MKNFANYSLNFLNSTHQNDRTVLQEIDDRTQCYHFGEDSMKIG